MFSCTLARVVSLQSSADRVLLPRPHGAVFDVMELVAANEQRRERAAEHVAIGFFVVILSGW